MEILLLPSSADETAVLRFALQRLGSTTHIVSDSAELMVKVQNVSADLLLLAYPKRDVPINTIRQLRTFSIAPLVIICEPQIEDTLISLLDAGADLIIFRPFSVRVFMAQLRALLRRASGMPIFRLPLLTQGDLTVDPSTRTVQVAQQAPKRLTQLEFRLLYILMGNPDQVVPTEQLIEYVWGYSGEGDRNLVRGLIKRLRAKIEPSPEEPRYIVTVTGLGYMFKPKV